MTSSPDPLATDAAYQPATQIGVPDLIVHTGSAVEVLRRLQVNAVDAVICNPLPAVGGAEPDRHRPRIARTGECGPNDIREQHNATTTDRAEGESLRGWVLSWAIECHRVLKPGGHLIAFGGTRNWHRLTSAIEDAGFDIRDSMAWLHTATSDLPSPPAEPTASTTPFRADADRGIDDHTPQADSGRRSHRGHSLTHGQPIYEPVVLARKPPLGTVAQNVLAYGTGALNVDATKLGNGRWPTNAFLDPAQARGLTGGDGIARRNFFVADTAEPAAKSHQPGFATAIPLALLRELVTLVTAPSATILDPFGGTSGIAQAVTLEGRTCVTVENDPRIVGYLKEHVRRLRVDSGPEVGSALDHETSSPSASRANVRDAQDGKRSDEVQEALF